MMTGITLGIYMVLQAQFFAEYKHLCYFIYMELAFCYATSPNLASCEKKIPNERTRCVQGSRKWQHVVFLNAEVFMDLEK